MLHLEYFADISSDDVFSYLFSNNRYDRRSDIKDSLELLEEGYNNSFWEQAAK